MKKLFALIFSFFLLVSVINLSSCKANAEPEPSYIAKLTYVVTYNTQYGVGPSAITVNPKTKLTEENLPILTETGRIFKGWFIGEEEITAGYVVSSNITLTAVWETEKYTITYAANTEIVQDDVKETYDYDTQISVKDNLFTVPVGYTFNFWNTAADGTGTLYKKGDKINLTKNITLYACWIEKGSHNITYANVNDSDLSENPKTFAEKNGVVLKPLSDTKFYKFGGWYKDINLTEEITGWNAGDYTTDVTVYAKWIPVDFTLSFDGNSGKGSMESITVTYGTIITLPEVQFTKAGYSFTGWNTQPDGKGLVFGNETPYSAVADSKLYAQWKINTYHIQYILNGGILSEDNILDYTVETDTFELNAPVKEGADFTGWFKKSDCSDTPISKIEKGATENLILYAGFKVKTFTVTFENNSNDVNGSMEAITLDYNVYTKLPAVTLERTGYSFVYWNTKADGKGGNSYLDGAQIVTTKDVTLYAIWELNKYSIKYNLESDATNENSDFYTVASDKFVLKPATKIGYDFVGWYLVENGVETETKIEEIITSTMAPVEVYAKWTPSTNTPYKVRYLLQNFENDDYSLDEEIELYGTTNESTAAVAKVYEGYELFECSQGKIAPDGSTIVEIKYNLPVVWFSFDGKGYKFGNENVSTLWISAKAGSSLRNVFAFSNPNRAGYAFGGWFDTVTNELIDLDAEVTESKKYYAKWSFAAKTVTLTKIEDIVMNVETNSDKTEITFTLPEGLASYKWILDDVELIGETSNTLTINTTSLVRGGVYTLYVETIENSIPKSAAAEFVVGE